VLVPHLRIKLEACVVRQGGADTGAAAGMGLADSSSDDDDEDSPHAAQGGQPARQARRPLRARLAIGGKVSFIHSCIFHKSFATQKKHGA
jgi:hypothetical protein